MRRSLLSAVLSLSILLSTLVAAQDASYTFTTFDVPGATNTEAFGINAAGQIVGVFGDATGSVHGFLTDGATFTPLDVPGATGTNAFGINDRGQIVGLFGDATGLHGFVATRGR
jgi:probable HAF family extracellular repeat protein